MDSSRSSTQEDTKMKKWTMVAIPVAVVVVFVAWYAFRPERLVINRRVDEAMPAAQGGSPAQPLESGRCEYGQYLSSISQQSASDLGKSTPFGGVILGSNPSGVAIDREQLRGEIKVES